MIRNYFKVALRYLARHKSYTAINILGLAVGVACCVLIMLFVRSEWSFDRSHTKSDRIYRAWLHENYGPDQEFINTVTPFPFAEALQSNYPEISATCRVYNFNSLIKKDQSSFNENVDMVDTSFFRIFDFPLLQGDIQHPFPSDNSVIITQSMAKKYFGDANPVGQTLDMHLDQDELLATVSGVAADCPQASSIQFSVLVPFSNIDHLFSKRAQGGWTNVFTETYVLLQPQTNASMLQSKFPELVKKVAGDEYKPGQYMINLQPLTDIHLDTSLPAGNQPISNPIYSYVLSIIGILILLLACINFITLTIGRATSRALEVGVRKVLGALRLQLVRQFWAEAFIIVFISLLIGVSLAALFLKPFNGLINRQLTIAPDPVLLLFCFGLLLVIGLIAGMYPAIVLSRFNSAEALKGKAKNGMNISFFRRTLIVGQFVASIAMIICTIVVGQQLQFIKNKNLGYQKEQVVVIPTHKRLKEGFELASLYKDEILKQSQVENASVCFLSFSETPWVNIGYTDNHDTYRNFQMNAVDADFIKTMGIQLTAGRNFAADNSADVHGSMLVNEALVKEYGWADPIGKKLPGSFNEQVIGVMKDFNYESLHTPIKPLMLVMRPDSVFRHANDINFASIPEPRITVRLRPGNLSQNIALLKSAWQQVAPNQDFEYHFLDESIANQYRQERNISAIIQIASALSIFIACIGLLGLITLIVTQRTKEIGIRKVLGASVSHIVAMLSKDFLKLIFIASVIAFPIAWWALNKWLQDFAYRVHIAWWVFVMGAMVALLIALITISIQSIKAALANPVEALRSE